jgi:hypothetical protein
VAGEAAGEDRHQGGAKKIVSSYDTYVRSNGTVCDCPSRPVLRAEVRASAKPFRDRAGAAPVCGAGAPPLGSEISGPLVVGEVYYLYCWQWATR